MNMISTGAFLTEMDASNKQETLAEKFAAVWEEKNSKVARMGGVSLMALSLAACGSSDDTPAADAGTGAGTDTGTDTGTDAGADAGTDAPVAPTTPVATALVGGEDTTGTAGADSFTGVTTGLTSTSSFLATDDIDGGEGADTIALQLGANFGGFTTTGTDTGSMTGIETVELTSSSSSARTFNATGVSGVETYKINGADGGVVSITGSADLAAIELSSIATGSFSVAYAAPTGGTSPVAGTEDTLNLTVAGLGSSTADISVTAAGVETLAITSNAAATAAGTTNYLNVSGASDATATKVSGAANTDIAAVSAATTSFDASAATGDVTAVLTNAATSALSSIKTGAGDDKVTATFGDMTLTATTDLGEGDDTLVLSGAGGSSSSLPNITGVETLDLSGMTGVATLSMSKSSGITNILLGDGSGTPTPFTGTINLVSETEARNIDVVGDATGTFTTDTAGAVDIDISADGKATSIAVDTNTATLTADTAASLDVSISGHTDYNGDITAGSAKSVVLTTSTTAQEFSLIAAKAESVNITAGKNLTFDADTNLAAAIDVDVATSGAFRSTAGTDSFVAVADMDLSGASTKSSVTIDNLVGATDLGYDMDITATGLQAGLTLTGGADSGTGNLTITATDVLGAVDTGNVDSGATFTFNASTLGANTIGNVAAKTAVINATNAVAGLTDGTYTIGSKVTLNGPATQVLDSAIVNGASDTSLTVVLNTGTGDDQIAIDTTAGTKSVTVSGDTGRSADDITISLDDYTTDTTSTITVDVSGLTKNTDAVDAVQVNVALELTNDSVVIKGSDDTGDVVNFEGADYTTNTVEHTLTKIDTIKFTDGVDLMASSLSGLTTTLSGSATSDAMILVGTSVGDTLTYANVTNSQDATKFTINAGAGDDSVTGTSGKDTINGQDGDDTLTGGEGIDVITGGKGDDTIILTETTKVADNVVFSAAGTNNGEDTITNFDAGSDNLDVTALITGTITADTDGVATADDGDLDLQTIVGTGRGVGVDDGLVFVYNEDGELAVADFATSAGDGKLVLGDGEEMIVVVAEEAASTSFNVYYAVDADATAGADTVTLVGTVNLLSGDTASDLLVGDFVIA